MRKTRSLPSAPHAPTHFDGVGAWGSTRIERPLYPKNVAVQALTRLLYPRKGQCQIHANVAGPVERAAVLIPHAHTSALVEQPLNIAAMLAAPRCAVQEHHVRALRTRIGHARKMLVHVIAEVVDVALDDLIELIEPLVALLLVGTDKL